MMASLGNPEKTWEKYQVLGELAMSFIVQSPHNGKVQDVSQVLASVICEAGSSRSVTVKLWYIW